MRIRDDQRGATLVIVAAALLMLVGAAALAVDLSALRADIRADRLAADAAATAGAIHISPSSGSTADVACQTAWDYLVINLDGTGASPDLATCSNLAGTCGSAARTATGSFGSYDIEITHPVPDGHDLMDGQPPNSDFDGTACQRLGVEVTLAREYAFAPVIGVDSGSTRVGAVSRVDFNVGDPEVVPLLVLEPESCNALYTSGPGTVTVDHFEDTPGLMIVDSDGTGGSGSDDCNTGNRYTIDVKNTNGWIRALPTPGPDPIQSAILSYALSGPSPGTSYDPADLTTSAPDGQPNLIPQPRASLRRVTRAPIDWRYNCKSNYPDYLGFVPVEPCPDSPAAHIDNHVSTYGSTIPPHFDTWDDCAPAGDISLAGDWFVDCPGGFVIDETAEFNDSNVVFAGDIDIRSDGRLLINQGSSDDHFVYVRGDGRLLKRAQSQIHLNQTFVYMEEGHVDLDGGAGGLNWTAPLDGNFEDLALWAEADTEFQIGGQSGNDLEGTFFTPRSDPFRLTGQGSQFQTDAQFLTRRLEVSGTAGVYMTPDPDRQTPIPTLAVRLIR